MLTNGELKQIRDVIETLLPDTCDILSATKASDGQGGYTTTWAASSESVKCRLDIKTGQEQDASGRLRPYQKATLSLPYDVTITTLDRVSCNSKTYNVTAVNNQQSWQGVTRCELEQV